MPEKVVHLSPIVNRLAVKNQMRFSDPRKNQTRFLKKQLLSGFLSQYKTQHPNNPDCEKALL